MSAKAKIRTGISLVVVAIIFMYLSNLTGTISIIASSIVFVLGWCFVIKGGLQEVAEEARQLLEQCGHND